MFTVCDAILSSSLMPNQNGHFAKKHLQTIKALNAVSRIKVQIQKWMSRESIPCKHETNKYRGEAELHNTLPVEITDPKTQLKPRSETWLTLSEILQQLSYKSLLEKIKLIQVPVTASHTRKVEMSNTSYQFRPFLCPVFKSKQ